MKHNLLLFDNYIYKFKYNKILTANKLKVNQLIALPNFDAADFVKLIIMPEVGRAFKKGLNVGVKAFFSYETEKIVQINSLKIGIINRLIQLLIIGYVIG